MYCTWESIDTDDGPRTTDHRRHFNLYYYLMSELSALVCSIGMISCIYTVSTAQYVIIVY